MITASLISVTLLLSGTPHMNDPPCIVKNEAPVVYHGWRFSYWFSVADPKVVNKIERSVTLLGHTRRIVLPYGCDPR